jgi:WD40 repeat protein
MVWEVSSGICLQTLKGHTASVKSVAFSHNSTRLASSSEDHTVKIWDVSSGACDSTGLYLNTEPGTTDSNSSRHVQYINLDMSTDCTWIIGDGQNLLWIPSEYRSSCSASSKSTVGIGTGSGRVWICRSTEDEMRNLNQDRDHGLK